MEKETIFEAECDKSTFFLKTIIELVSNLSYTDNISITNEKEIKQICMKISKDRIEIFTDSMKVVSSKFLIYKNFFNTYKYFEEDSELCIGISLDIIKSCFKYVHKNNKLHIKIEKDVYDNFPNIISFTLDNIKGFDIKFNIIQNIDNSFDCKDYINLTNIPSDRLTNLHKEIGGSKKQVNYILNKDKLKLSSTMLNISENWVEFLLSYEKQKYDHINFPTTKAEYFKNITKLSAFNDSINISINQRGDLFMKTSILESKYNKNELGIIYLFIVNKN